MGGVNQGIYIPVSLRRSRNKSFPTKEMIERMKWNTSNFERLVLGCIDSYDSEQRLIFQDFSRSTRFFCLRTAQTSKFQQKIVKRFLSFSFSFRFWSLNLVIFPRKIDGILSEFHGYSQKMMNCLEILRKTARKMRKKAEKSGIGAKFHPFLSLFQACFNHLPITEQARWAAEVPRHGVLHRGRALRRNPRRRVPAAQR